jgi:cephalosporin-C deacetylase
MHRDLPIEELRTYQGTVSEPADFDTFWGIALRESRAAGGRAKANRLDAGLSGLDVFDVTYPGFAGEPIKAWLRIPHSVQAPPLVVEYAGYGGGRGLPIDDLTWAALGFAHQRMDNRGQGAVSHGDTPDPYGSGPQVPGFTTKGITKQDDYYYLRLLVDAVRAVEAGQELAGVDGQRIAVVGRSQGGLGALAAAALAGSDLRAAAIFSPFMTDIMAAINLTDALPYHEISSYLRARPSDARAAAGTLSYVDGVNFARRATVPAHFSVGLADEVTPPRTAFAAFNAYAGPKTMAVWDYAGHEGGALADVMAAAEFFWEQFN